MTQRVLNYDHVIAPQEKSWDCGPASTQIVLNSRGIIESEDALIRDIGTTTNGTDDISWVEHSFDRRLPQANYTSVHLPDYPNQEQRDRLWENLTRSINAGYGLVVNWVVPPSNRPRGVKGSPNASYPNRTIFHYVALMGYDDADRTVWIADPGFQPFGYWITFDQLCTLIPPKGYAFADVQPADSVEELMASNQQKLDDIWNKFCAYPDAPEIGGKWKSRARCRRNDAGVDDTVGMILYEDANLYDLLIAWSAVTVGDPFSVETIKLGANAQLPAKDAASVAWFKAVAAKLPK